MHVKHAFRESQETGMSILYPRLKLSHLPLMGWIGLQGVCVAGVYGILHDQVTYTISPEYFTAFKAEQFRYMDFGWPERVYAGQIGFMATWWVGLIVGWFLARLTVPELEARTARRWCWQGFVLLVVAAFVASIAGAGLGWWETRHGAGEKVGLAKWQDFARGYGVRDVAGFTRAAFIHNGSYLGVLLGLTGACLWIRRRVRRLRDRLIAVGPPSANAESRTL